MTKKTRIRITIIAVCEYDADPKHYDDTTPEGILATDLKTARNDTYAVLDGATSWDIKGEILK